MGNYQRWRNVARAATVILVIPMVVWLFLFISHPVSLYMVVLWAVIVSGMISLIFV
jgi:hypothetical protein